jgi:tetratricopeptide (TPR) repeat protein
MKLSFPKSLPKVALIVFCLLLGVFILARSGDLEKISPTGTSVAEAKDGFIKPLEERGRPSEAVAAYEKMVEADPDRVEGYLGLGVLYFKLGLSSKAREIYLKAVERGVADGQIYFNLGYIEEIQADFPKALEHYLKAEAELLKNGDLFYNIGNVYAQMNDLDRALQYYTRAVAVKPGHMDAFVNLSVVSFRKEAYADADFYLQKAVRLGYQAPPEYIKTLSEKLGKKP